MPEPLSPGQRYLPGLDGLRALAVSAVVLYHVGLGWAAGGLLGVGVFFTLSGYLITDLLLSRSTGTGIRIGEFWAARARRLLPGLLSMLLVVTAWVELIGPAQQGFTAAAAASALYVSNWQLVFQHVSYFARFGPPSPLGHLWSLGVEEQFYILWPLLLVLGLRLVPERSRVPGIRPRLGALTLLLAALSAAEMCLLYRPGFDTSRVYYGTDTRAFELLVGAALAMVWPSRLLRANVAAGARRSCDAAGVAGLAGIAILIWRTNEYSPFLYRGGFGLLTLATAAVVAALVHPACRLGDVLGAAPLRWLGMRSYGVYLWHIPVLALTTPMGKHNVDYLRAALQITATIALAAGSWRFIEQPIRTGALRRNWPRGRPVARHGPGMRRVGLRSIFQASAVVAVLASIVAVLTAASSGRGGSAAQPVSTSTEQRAGWMTVPVSPLLRPAVNEVTGADQSRSSCRAVVDIGDSTSEGLISTDYLPNPEQRLDAQYEKVGVKIQHFEISGARSIVETYEGQPNATEVAEVWKRDGYHGCWVLALGTNDTADVYVGSHVTLDSRIGQMMAVIGHAPVLWVDVKTLLGSGPYSEHNMQLWNDALVRACHRYENLRVLEWSADARNAWFISDGIHYGTPGYAARARLIASGLAKAFPAEGHSAGCLVR